MRHLISFKLMTIVSIIILSGCNSSEELKPIKEESIDFDLNTATEMIKKKEEFILQLSMKKTISSREYNEFEKAFTKEFGQHAQRFLSMFIILGSEKKTESDTFLVQDTFYPTVFHKGIIVTDAVIRKSYYENEFFNQTFLRIKQEYTGDDKRLKGWKREYVFTKNEDGEWGINAFSGEMNFVGKGYSMRYLDFKE